MQLHLLHLDEALKRQSDFINACHEMGAVEQDAVATGSMIRLWGKQDIINNFEQYLKSRFMVKGGVPVTFFGSGDFHHVTSLFLPIIFEQSENKITVIHFDNHPDWVKSAEVLHCGSWVNRALAMPQVDRVITIGVTSKDLHFPECKGANLNALKEGKIILYPYFHKPSFVCGNYGAAASYQQIGHHLHWRNLQDMQQEELLVELLAHIRTSNIYITFDKDVLRQEDAITNWDQGGMTLASVLWLISGLSEQRGIAGIDVNGDYSPPYYGGNFTTKIKKQLEVAIDQPWQKADMAKATTLNSLTNLKLLNCFKEIIT